MHSAQMSLPMIELLGLQIIERRLWRNGYLTQLAAAVRQGELPQELIDLPSGKTDPLRVALLKHWGDEEWWKIYRINFFYTPNNIDQKYT